MNKSDFASHGARVVVADIQQERGAAVAADLGDSALFRSLNVCDLSAWERLMAELQGQHRGLDILVNNAGGAGGRRRPAGRPLS